MSSSSFLIRREYSSYVIMKFSSSAIQNNVMQVSLYYNDLLSRTPNFAILARQYFAGFYFRDFLWANMKRGIKRQSP